MVSLVSGILVPLLHGLMKLAGVTPQAVEIEPGTTMNIWVPKQTINRAAGKWNKPAKPALVFVHPFCADGILMWFLQVLAFSGKYSVYVPDLLFFGGSTTSAAGRSASFQAEFLAKGLRKLGVQRCTVVGLSYGGMVGFKMAEMYPDLVENMVVSSTVMELTESLTRERTASIGRFSSWAEILLPETMEGVKFFFSIGFRKLPWLPRFLYNDFLQTLFGNRKEKAELLEALVVSDSDDSTSIIPNYSQRILFLWGDEDKIFSLELAQSMKERVGEKASLQWVEKAGHLLQMERPFAYNTLIRKFLSSL
ncbi:uncharacterized protein LOC127801019 [Diospyros lotus]|uniref:uncharacterized protein LOC127801019 n=1 Tax=Diospyros lotus TaxID=55363 RepID=UPI002256E16A|nr:uncharacterized protein LOC127801019 [Diospyros lotus]